MCLGLPDGMSGILLTKKLTKIFQDKMPPIFILTAHADEKTILECFEVGMVYVFQKPFSVYVLNKIKKHIGK